LSRWKLFSPLILGMIIRRFKMMKSFYVKSLYKLFVLLFLLSLISCISSVVGVKGQSTSLTGYILFDNKPVSKITEIIPEIIVRDNENFERFMGEVFYDPQTGRYEIQDIQPGDYEIEIFIDASEPFNGYIGYADDYYGYHWSVIVPDNQEIVNYNLTVERIIHLISPIDNSVPVNHTIQVYNATELFFEWVPLPEAEWYEINIHKYKEDPHEYIGQVYEKDTEQSFVKLYLPPSEENEVYHFELRARNSTWVGILLISYDDNSWGGFYPFKRDSSVLFFGSLRVTVEDEQGNAVTGAYLTVRSRPKGENTYFGRSTLLGPTEFLGIVEGTYEVIADKPGYEPAAKTVVVKADQIIEITIQLSRLQAVTSISCNASLISISVGEEVTISGSISPAVSGARVNITYMKPNGATFTRTTTTGSDGSYSDAYTPIEVGSWSVKASWEGDLDYTGAESEIISFTVVEKPKGGIPGFPYESIIFGLALGAFILWIIQRRK